MFIYVQNAETFAYLGYWYDNAKDQVRGMRVLSPIWCFVSLCSFHFVSYPNTIVLARKCLEKAVAMDPTIEDAAVCPWSPNSTNDYADLPQLNAVGFFQLYREYFVKCWLLLASTNKREKSIFKLVRHYDIKRHGHGKEPAYYIWYVLIRCTLCFLLQRK